MKKLIKITTGFWTVLIVLSMASAAESNVAIPEAAKDLSSTSSSKFISRLEKKQEMLMDLKDFRKEYKSYVSRAEISKETEKKNDQVNTEGDTLSGSKYVSRLENKLGLLVTDALSNMQCAKQNMELPAMMPGNLMPESKFNKMDKDTPQEKKE